VRIEVVEEDRLPDNPEELGKYGEVKAVASQLGVTPIEAKKLIEIRERYELGRGKDE